MNHDSAADDSKSVERKCVWVALLIGFFEVFSSRWLTGPDAISYLDLGELWLKGDVANAVNGYWNPIYPLLLGIASKLVGNPIYEPIAAHAVNFAVYGLNLFLYSRLLQAMRRVRFAGEESESPFDGLFTLLAYVLFVWCHVSLIELTTISPDLILTSTIIGSTICLVRLIESDQARSYAAGLGLALAIGYLAKAVMFVAAPFFILAALLCATGRARGIRNAAIAMVVFVVVSAPYIVLLSRQQGHFTYSESGKIAYAWMVNRTREYFHWQGVEPGTGAPVHPTRQLLREPEVFEFGDRPGTYPPWFDPAYWHEGLKVRLDLRQQVRAIARDLRVFYTVVFQHATSIVFLVIFAAGFSAISLRGDSRWRRTWPLMVPALAGCCIYLPVYVIARHLGPFLVILYSVGLWNTWPAARRHLPARVIKTMAVCALIPILYTLVDSAVRINVVNRIETTAHQRVALALKESGLRPGDRIAVLGRGCEAAYARMAGVKVVAEAYRHPWAAPSWAIDAEAEARAVAALKPVGVKAIVRDIPVSFESTLPWKRIRETQYSILVFDGGTR